MDHAKLDQRLMSRALGLAQEAYTAGEVPVGALIYDPATETVLAEASNSPIAAHDPTAHAEINAMRRAAKTIGNYRLGGLWLYVTLEPCTMCAGAISHARLERLIFGASDPKGGAVISGTRFFEQSTCHWRPAVTHGIMAEPAGALLRDFFKARRQS